jgi:hypothetical protein
MTSKKFNFTVDELLNVFASQVGQHESPNGSNHQKWGTWYGMDRVSYCGIGVGWCFAHVKNGIDLRKIGISPAYTPSFLASGTKSAYFTRVPRSSIRKGDVVFFNFPDKVYRTQHVGISTSSVQGRYFKTIEFNTSDSNSGSQDNGGGVYHKIRTISVVSGVLRPHYKTTLSPIRKPKAKPKARPTLREGDHGANVVYLQGKLGLTKDGIFGPKTKATVIAFQRKKNLVPDGIVGPLTWRALG